MAMVVSGTARGVRLAFGLAVALAMAACAKEPASDQVGAIGGVGGGGVATPGSQQDFATNVGDRVFFDSDSAELTPTAQGTLDKQANWLTKYGRYTFTIAGHADERGTREYNFALGAKRAETTKNYLIAKGVAPTRMKTISFGKERPVAVCDDISCWSQNRRAVTVLAGAPGS